MQRFGKAIVVLGISAGGLSTGGCAALPIAALGVVGNAADIGSTAFSVGTEVFTSGKLESVEMATFEQAQHAVRWMLNDLRLHVEEIKPEKTTAFYRIKDDYGSQVKFTLQRRSPAITGVRVDVGWFGSEAYARLLLKSIRGRLPATRNAATSQPMSPLDLQSPKLPTGLEADDPER